jgi:hypothetical protein
VLQVEMTVSGRGLPLNLTIGGICGVTVGRGAIPSGDGGSPPRQQDDGLMAMR